MKLNLLVATSQLNSKVGTVLGTGTSEGLSSLADLMSTCGIVGDIYDLPNGVQRSEIASPFSLINGFALKTDELSISQIPELREDHTLQNHINKIEETHNRFFRNKRSVNYALKRSLMPWILESCFQHFQEKQYQHRQEQFLEFQSMARYWLDDYALYEAYKKREMNLATSAYQNRESEETAAFIKSAGELIDYFKYQQFVCFEQKQAIRQRINRKNIELIVNLPFGVELKSADVFFHPEVFDVSMQVGCSPEPEHGYPEQAWGIAAYREKSQGLKIYLEEKMKWLALLGDGIFLDHMVGWCGQYVLPMTIPETSTYPHGEFLTTDPQERVENMNWFLDIVLQTGLKVRGEIAGDHQRVQATLEAIKIASEAGYEIGAMAIPRWETDNNLLKPLSSYSPATLTMVETHDTSTLLQYLLNRKGYNEDFEAPEQILAFCLRVLGLPFFLNDIPLESDTCDESFWFEICRRFSNGSPSNELVFTLPGLLSILSPDYRTATIENNINVKPGTSGAVGNGWGNWSYFSPPIEIMTEDPTLQKQLRNLGQRSYTPFDYFHRLDNAHKSSEALDVIYSKIGTRNIICQNKYQQWSVWKKPSSLDADDFILELVLKNTGEEELWERVDVSSLIELNIASRFRFIDLNDELTAYTYEANDLKANQLFIRLASGQVHHFLVTEKP